VVAIGRLAIDTVNQFGTKNPQQGHKSEKEQGTKEARQPTKKQPGKARRPAMEWARREP
jgi:hypothetical protein